MIIGAPDHQALGAAYIYSDVSGTWTQEAELTPPRDAGESGVKFGTSVAISGSTAMVGADGGGNGAVYSYSDVGGTWTPGAELTAPDGGGTDEFGWSLALSRSTLVVSAVNHAWSGAIYVFTDLAGTWTYRTELTASDGATNDYFGDKVATDGTRIVAGAPGHDGMQGAAYVFDGSGASWKQEAELDGLRRRPPRLLRLGRRPGPQDHPGRRRKDQQRQRFRLCLQREESPEVDPATRADGHRRRDHRPVRLLGFAIGDVGHRRGRPGRGWGRGGLPLPALRRLTGLALTGR